MASRAVAGIDRPRKLVDGGIEVRDRVLETPFAAADHLDFHPAGALQNLGAGGQPFSHPTLPNGAIRPFVVVHKDFDGNRAGSFHVSRRGAQCRTRAVHHGGLGGRHAADADPHEIGFPRGQRAEEVRRIGINHVRSAGSGQPSRFAPSQRHDGDVPRLHGVRAGFAHLPVTPLLGDRETNVVRGAVANHRDCSLRNQSAASGRQQGAGKNELTIIRPHSSTLTF